MERLSFSEESIYSGWEASIHIARYALAKELCRGRRVLDIACGEGYGSRLMLDWGATEVVGVDVSEETIAAAKVRFGCEGIRYLSGNAETVENLLAGEQFDLIVSLETIEHLNDPVAYLHALSKLRASTGVIVISCPNDWWYYPEVDQSNPYHIRKYTYKDFLELAVPVLGQPDAVGLGVFASGFMNVPLDRFILPDSRITQTAMMAAKETSNVYIVPIEPNSVSDKNSSYFVAQWGGLETAIAGGGLLPIPMDVFNSTFTSSRVVQQQQSERKNQVQLSKLSRDITELGASVMCDGFERMSLLVKIAAVSVENNVLKGNVEEMQVRLEGLKNENERLKDENERLKLSMGELSLAASRYYRLRSMVPSLLWKLGRAFRSLLRGVH